MNQRSTWSLGLCLLACAAAGIDGTSVAITYDLFATIGDGKVTLEHRLINGSDISICLFPDQVDGSDARFLDSDGNVIENIATTGTITAWTTIYISYPDRVARSFVSVRNLSEIFRPLTDSDQVSQVEFEFFSYDCHKLVAKNYLDAQPVFRKIVRVMVKREL